MKHSSLILFLLFMVSFLIFKHVTILHYISLIREINTQESDLVSVLQNISSTNNVSNPKTREPQATSDKRSTTVEHSYSFREIDFCPERKINRITEVPLFWRNRCPEKPVVTISQYGRLGNQLWEYASVWAVAKTRGHEAFVPSCLIESLEEMFVNVTAIPPLKYIEHCPIKIYRLWTMLFVNVINDSISLPMFIQTPEFVIPHLKEVLQLFRFRDHLVNKSQMILRTASNGVKGVVYVCVHIRRTDYKSFLKGFGMSFLNRDYFVRQMNYFRKKFSKVKFLIVSDDPDWCERQLSADDTVVVRGNSPEQDLSLMASCNHTILDYGTYGLWGALLAGGETLMYNQSTGMEIEVAKLMPNWHIVT